MAEVFRGYGMSDTEAAPVVAAIRADRDRWVDFMMKFELGLEKPDPRRARQSAFTIALSYVVGGLIPLSPYMIIGHIMTALYVSIGVTMAALFVFGFVKGRFTGLNPVKSGAQTVLIGGLAASAAFLIARMID